MKIATIPIAADRDEDGDKAVIELASQSRAPAQLWIVIGQFPTPERSSGIGIISVLPIGTVAALKCCTVEAAHQRALFIATVTLQRFSKPTYETLSALFACLRPRHLLLRGRANVQKPLRFPRCGRSNGKRSPHHSAMAKDARGSQRADINAAISKANAETRHHRETGPEQSHVPGSTIGALDDIQNGATSGSRRRSSSSRPTRTPPMRDAAEKAIKVFQDWAVGVDYREDVYKAVKAYADTKPKLEGEDALLLEHTLRDYRRAGLALPPRKTRRGREIAQGTGQARDRFPGEHRGGESAGRFQQSGARKACRTAILESPGVKTGDDSITPCSRT